MALIDSKYFKVNIVTFLRRRLTKYGKPSPKLLLLFLLDFYVHNCISLG